MAEALRLHRNATANRPSLVGKQVQPSPFKTPRDYPALADRYKADLDYAGSVARSCIHCHQIRDAERRLQRSTGEPMPDKVLFPYPDPAVVGLKMDPTQMANIATVVSDSSADRDGFKAGDEIVYLERTTASLNRRFQWVLHHAPATAKLPAQVRRDQ